MIVIYFLTPIVASLLTYETSKFKKIGPIRASAGITLLSFFDFYMINYFYPIDIDFMMALSFGGSFVGMSCPKKMNHLEIILGAIFFTLLFIYLVPLLPGMGGALGTSAFFGVVVVLLARKLFKSLSK